jgi:3'-phosphoadenosine 5'-phosphosulfate sulfotransferase (PAPS reductase)/FAD synthetase
MQNLSLGLNALFRGTEVVRYSFYFIGTTMMFGSVSKHFTNLRHVKDQNLCFGPECTISRYRSCKACILLHWTQNDVWECLRAFRQPSTRKKMQNLCFGPECTISGYRSCKVFILFHWNQNDVWECFRAFR